MISKIYNFFKDIKETIKEFNLYSRYMSFGAYVFDDSIRYIFLDDSFTYKKSTELFHNVYKTNKIRGFLVFLLKNLKYKNRLIISKQTQVFKDFKGTIYFPTRNCKKIFDLSSHKVLSLYSKKEEYTSIIDSYIYFKQHFPMPNILYTDEKQLFIIEQLILFQPNSLWVKEDYLYVIEDIFKRYITYAEACKENVKYCFISPTDYMKIFEINDDKYISEIRSKIPKDLLSIHLPALRLHGDLWTTNILVQKSDRYSIHYIDWEFSQDLLFFYDFFNLMWVEVYNHNNYLYIDNYVNGMYDHYFNELFLIYNLKYEPKFRMEYFHVFFLQFYLVRLINLQGKDKNKYFRQYRKLSRKISN